MTKEVDDMSLVEITGLSHGYQEKSLYENAAFALYGGDHVGVVGQNGAGKSTLLRILTGEVVPDKGQIRWQPGVRVGYLDQQARVPPGLTVEQYLHTAFALLYEQEKQMEQLYSRGAAAGEEALLLRAAACQQALEAAGFYEIGSAVSRVASGLGLDAMGLDRPMGRLSGGQRAKVILGKLLLQKDDVMLLDEPTNFLDQAHVKWLAQTLAAFPGAFLVVSHDHDFLQQAVGCVCDISFGSIRKYYGTYSEFVAQKAHLRQDYVNRYEAQQRQIARTEEYIRRNIAGVNTRIAQGRRKQLERLERLAPPGAATKPQLAIRQCPLPGQKALELRQLAVGYDTQLLPPLTLAVQSGEKLAVTGFNGIGKSTLMKTLAGRLAPLGGAFQYAERAKVGYYEQDLKWTRPQGTPLEILREAYPRRAQQELRRELACNLERGEQSILFLNRRELARCGLKADLTDQPVQTLSGGEQAKVKLCLLLLEPVNFLLLDEPTNHLDAETKEALEEALRRFGGSVILVSHEAAFYKSWADRVLDVEACFEI